MARCSAPVALLQATMRFLRQIALDLEDVDQLTVIGLGQSANRSAR
jgi:hypothetical protein